jgi:hypothetical protein
MCMKRGHENRGDAKSGYTVVDICKDKIKSESTNTLQVIREHYSMPSHRSDSHIRDKIFPNSI